MKCQRVCRAVGVAMVAAGLASWMLGSGSTTHYQTMGSGRIEFYPNGQLKCVKGDATCDGTKVDIAGGVAKIAGAIIQGASVVPNTARVSADPQGTQPLFVGGQPVELQPSPPVAAEAQNFSPAPPGHMWHGWQSQELLEGFTGPIHAEGTVIMFFDEGAYPLPSEVGPHILRIYISDSAGMVTPAVQEFPIYGIVPTLSEWGLIILSVLLAAGGAVLILRARGLGLRPAV